MSRAGDSHRARAKRSAASVAPPFDVEATLREADCLCTAREVEAAYDRMAGEISARIARANPLLLAVMVGGLIPAGELIGRFSFPLEIDYLHATRYRNGTTGKELEWLTRPTRSLDGRTVLLVDDVLDEGHTLTAVMDYLNAGDADTVLSAVFVSKQREREPGIAVPDFVGLEVADRYLFGCGMDYQGYLRNVRGVYAVRGL